MKKQIAKLSLKTDQIVSLSKAQAQNVLGGMRPVKISDTNCSTHQGCPVKF
ncbi:class I lanthipeptide [Larkinella soli]|uniref:class I lanthipeptide n=1 Tax=Larkinella soli TaxID=1770527 RepID=UPI0013E2FF9A|nr:class I lanthipeptide [Larkinella soli]